MKPTVFIDGEAGTTGLQIHSRLQTRSDIQLLSLPPHDRKNPTRRTEALNSCDIAVLCLPDEAAREAVSFVSNPKVRILDASSAHRTSQGWVYGLPEMEPTQACRISEAARVSNPGCYPTGAILLMRPLVDAGILPHDYPVNVHAVSGYSGAGRQLIDQYESSDPSEKKTTPFAGYAFGLSHKHVPEMQAYSRLSQRPLFTPAYAQYKQGIVLYIPLHMRLLAAQNSIITIHKALSQFYESSKHVKVQSLEAGCSLTSLEPEMLNGTNDVAIWAFGSRNRDQTLLAAVYDNLGKGASGAAVQNLDLMLGRGSKRASNSSH